MSSYGNWQSGTSRTYKIAWTIFAILVWIGLVTVIVTGFIGL